MLSTRHCQRPNLRNSTQLFWEWCAPLPACSYPGWCAWGQSIKELADPAPPFLQEKSQLGRVTGISSRVSYPTLCGTKNDPFHTIPVCTKHASTS